MWRRSFSFIHWALASRFVRRYYKASGEIVIRHTTLADRFEEEALSCKLVVCGPPIHKETGFGFSRKSCYYIRVSSVFQSSS